METDTIPKVLPDLRAALLDIFQFSVTQLTQLASEDKPSDPKVMSTLSTLVTKLASAVVLTDITPRRAEKIEETPEVTENDDFGASRQEHEFEEPEKSAGQKIQCPKCDRRILGKGPLASHMKMAHGIKGAIIKKTSKAR